MAHAYNPNTWGLLQECHKREASLGYTVSSRPDWARMGSHLNKTKHFKELSIARPSGTHSGGRGRQIYVSLRLAWSKKQVKRVPEQLGLLHRETLSQKNKTNKQMDIVAHAFTPSILSLSLRQPQLHSETLPQKFFLNYLL